MHNGLHVKLHAESNSHPGQHSISAADCNCMNDFMMPLIPADPICIITTPSFLDEYIQKDVRDHVYAHPRCHALRGPPATASHFSLT